MALGDYESAQPTEAAEPVATPEGAPAATTFSAPQPQQSASAPAPPPWKQIEASPEFQSADPARKLVAFDRWHSNAYNYNAAQPDWNQHKDEFNKDAADKQEALGHEAWGGVGGSTGVLDAARRIGFAGPMSPDEARQKIAKDKVQEVMSKAGVTNVHDLHPQQLEEALTPLGDDVKNSIAYPGKNYQLRGNNIDFTPGAHAEGLKDAAANGVVSQEQGEKYLPAAQVLDQDYNKLVASAGANPELKAALDEGMTQFVSTLAGVKAAAWAGGTKEVPGVISGWLARTFPGLAARAAVATAEAAPAIAGEEVAGGVLAPETLGVSEIPTQFVAGLTWLATFLATQKVANPALEAFKNQLGKYNDTVKSLQDSVQLHPTAAQVGGFVGGLGPFAKEIANIPKLLSDLSSSDVKTAMAARKDLMGRSLAALPVTLAQGAIDRRWPGISDYAQNVLFGALLSHSPDDSPAVSAAKTEGRAKFDAALQRSAEKAGNGAPQVANVADIGPAKKDAVIGVTKAAARDQHVQEQNKILATDYTPEQKIQLLAQEGAGRVQPLDNSGNRKKGDVFVSKTGEIYDAVARPNAKPGEVPALVKRGLPETTPTPAAAPEAPAPPNQLELSQLRDRITNSSDKDALKELQYTASARPLSAEERPIFEAKLGKDVVDKIAGATDVQKGAPPQELGQAMRSVPIVNATTEVREGSTMDGPAITDFKNTEDGIFRDAEGEPVPQTGNSHEEALRSITNNPALSDAVKDRARENFLQDEEHGFEITKHNGEKAVVNREDAGKLMATGGKLQSHQLNKLRSEVGAAPRAPVNPREGVVSNDEDRTHTNFQKDRTEPGGKPLTTDYRNIFKDPAQTEKIAARLREYLPKDQHIDDDQKQIEKAVNFMVENQRALWDRIKNEPWLKDSLGAYDDYHKEGQRQAGKFRLALNRVIHAFAAVSPQKSPDMGAAMTERIADVVKNHADDKWTSAMTKTFLGFAEDTRLTLSERKTLAEVLKNKKFSDLNNFQKALFVRAYDQTYNDRNYPIVGVNGEHIGTSTDKLAWPSYKQISNGIQAVEGTAPWHVLVTNKIANFFNNMVAPHSEAGDVTSDTHHASTSWLRPLGPVGEEQGPAALRSSQLLIDHFQGPKSATSGERGFNSLAIEATRRLANELGLLPQQLQAGLWFGQRGYLARDVLSKKTVEQISQLWDNASNGKISTEDARRQTFEIGDNANGGKIKPPEWFHEGRPGGAAATGNEPTGDTGKLPQVGRLPEGDAASGGRSDLAGGNAGGLGARVGAEPGNSVGRETVATPNEKPDAQGRTQIAESRARRGGAVDVGAASRLPKLSPADEEKLTKEINERAQSMLPAAAGVPKIEAGLGGGGSSTWNAVYSNGDKEILFHPARFERDVRDIMQTGRTREQAIDGLLREEIVHNKDNVDPDTAARHSIELVDSNPELAKQIAERYISTDLTPAARAKQLAEMTDPENATGMVQLSHEAVYQIAHMMKTGTLPRDAYVKLPTGIIERVKDYYNRLIQTYHGNKAYEQLNEEMKARVDEARRVLDLMGEWDKAKGAQATPEVAKSAGQAAMGIGTPPRGPPDEPVVSGAGFLAPNGEFHPGPKQSHEPLARSIASGRGETLEPGASAQRHIMDNGYVRVTTENYNGQRTMYIEGNPSAAQLRILKDSAIEQKFELVHDIPTSKYKIDHRVLYSPTDVGAAPRPEYASTGRKVSEEELDNIKKRGQERLEAYKGQGQSTAGLEGDKWEQAKTDAFAKVQKPDGGETYDPRTGEAFKPEKAESGPFAVSAKHEGQEAVRIPANATKAEFDAAMEKAKEQFPQLKDANHYLGVFHDAKLNEIHIDPVVIAKSTAEAEEIGAHTNAVGGAYNYATGNGLFPPRAATEVGDAKRGEPSPEDFNAHMARLAAKPAEPAAGIGPSRGAMEERGISEQIPTAEGTSTAGMQALGQKMIAEGHSPDARIAELKSGPDALRQSDPVSDAALFRAHLDNLDAAVNAARDKGDRDAVTTGEKKVYDAIKDIHDFVAVPWHKIGEALQRGEPDINSEHGIRKELAYATGKVDVTEKQQKRITQISKEAQTAQTEKQAVFDKGMKQLDSLIKDDPKIPTGDWASIKAYFDAQRGGQATPPPAAPQTIGVSPRGEESRLLGRELTLPEIKALWKMAQPLITPLDAKLKAVFQQVADLSGLAPEDVTRAFAANKTMKNVTQEMYTAMSHRSEVVKTAKAWVERQGMTPAGQIFDTVMDFPRSIAVLGHANSLITHAGRNLFTPLNWNNWGKSFVDQYRILFDVANGEAFHEQMMQDLESHDGRDSQGNVDGSISYMEARKGGLAVARGAVDNYAQYMSEFLGKGPWAAIQRRGAWAMDALKPFRMRMLQEEWAGQGLKDLSPADWEARGQKAGISGTQARADAISRLSDTVNHGTGYTQAGARNPILRKVGFAPGLEFSRWAWAYDYPKAVEIMTRWGKATPGEQASVIMMAKRAGQMTGTLLTALSVNQAIQYATGQKDHGLNFPGAQFIGGKFDSNQKDFMKFKFGERTVDPSGGLFQPIQLISHLLSIAHASGSGTNKNILDEIATYAAGKITPTLSIAKDVLSGETAIGKPLPPIWGLHPQGVKSKQQPYSWLEYLESHSPIPASEAFKAYHDAVAEGSSPASASALTNFVASGVVGLTGAREGKESKKPWKVPTH
jgi:hypothetical protein